MDRVLTGEGKDTPRGSSLENTKGSDSTRCSDNDQQPGWLAEDAGGRGRKVVVLVRSTA